MYEFHSDSSSSIPAEVSRIFCEGSKMIVHSFFPFSLKIFSVISQDEANTIFCFLNAKLLGNRKSNKYFSFSIDIKQESKKIECRRYSFKIGFSVID